MSKGFTLIEVVIYIAIFALMIGFVATIVWRIGDSSSANRGRVSVETEADFTMAKIKWAMAGVSVIGLPAASSTGNMLSVSKFNFSQNPIAIQLMNGAVTLSRASGTAVAITSPNVYVTNLIFTHNPEAVSQPESVNIALSLRASSSDPRVIASTTLQNTIYLRK